MSDLGSIVMLTLDVAVIGALGLALWRFGRDPSADWEEREARLTGAVQSLRTLVREAEEQAQMIDAQLAGHLEALRGALRASPSSDVGPPAPGETARLRQQIQDLAARATPLEEIARRVDLPVAEVRLLVGLRAAQAGKKVAAKTAA